MAESILQHSQLRLILNNGTDPETDRVKTKTKSFNNVTEDATADQLYAVANALVSLQTLPLHDLQRVDTSDLME